MLTATFIRHGQSEDNLKRIWTGWKDAPLSELAAALGRAFSNTKIDSIYASDLLCAHATGQVVLNAHSFPKPVFTSTPKFREQHFGIAEGRGQIRDSDTWGIFPVLRGREQSFPDGDSLDDLARRAEKAINECVVAHLAAEGDLHIAIASHSLCISELVAALLRLDPDSRRDISFSGLLNTAWTQAVVSLKDGSLGKGPLDIYRIPSLTVKITEVNNTDLASLEV
ncbi:histidine phosphatase superfamily [Mycena epipterygia]|nr:histidine phosphatase superfamily [Mycena epipterygia]